MSYLVLKGEAEGGQVQVELEGQAVVAHDRVLRAGIDDDGARGRGREQAQHHSPHERLRRQRLRLVLHEHTVGPPVVRVHRRHHRLHRGVHETRHREDM